MKTKEPIHPSGNGASTEKVLLDATIHYLSRLQPELVDAAYRAAILRWFNPEMLEAVLGAGELSDIELPPPEKRRPAMALYTLLQKLPYVQPFTGRGFAFHDLTRSLLIDHLWRNERDFYRQVSIKAAEALLARYQAEMDQVGREEKKIEQVDRDLLVEYAYHLIVSGDEKAEATVDAIQNDLLEVGLLNYFQSILLAIRDHLQSGRLSESARHIVEFWQVQEAYNTLNLPVLKELADTFLDKSRLDFPPDLKANVAYLYAHVLLLSDQYEEAGNLFIDAFGYFKEQQDGYGMVRAAMGLGDVEYDRENYEEAGESYAQALNFHVGQIRVPAAEDSELGDDTPLRVFSPYAWHRREVVFTPMEEAEEAYMPIEGAAEEAGQGEMGEVENSILYLIEVDLLVPEEGEPEMAGDDEEELPTEWPILVDQLAGQLWLKFGYLEQLLDHYDLSAACAHLALDIFYDLGDLDGSQDAVNLLRSLGNQVVDVGYSREASQFRHQLVEEAEKSGNQSAMLYGLINQAEDYIYEERDDEARESFQKALEIAVQLNSKNDQATCLDGLARLSLSQMSYDLAEKQFRRALELYEQVGNRQGWASTLLNLGDLLLTIHDNAGARARYREAYEAYERANSLTGQFLTILKVANLDQVEGRYDQALQILREALALSRKVKRVSSEIDALDEMARLHRLLGQKGQASRRFNQAVQISMQRGSHERTMHLFQSHGRLLVEIAAYEQAIELLDKAIEINRDYVYAYREKASALQALGKVRGAQALEAYQKAHELVPDDVWTRRGIADALRLSGDEPGAIAEYRAVVEKIEASSRKNFELPTLAWCYYQLGEYEQSEAIHRLVLARDPEPISDLFDLGLVLLCQKKFDQAQEVYAEGIERLRTRFPERRRLGFIAVALGDLQELLELQPAIAGETCAQIQARLREEWHLAYGTEE